MEGDKVGYFLLIFGHEDTLGLVFDMLEKLCLSNVMEYVLYCVYNVNIISMSFTYFTWKSCGLFKFFLLWAFIFAIIEQYIFKDTYLPSKTITSPTPQLSSQLHLLLMEFTFIP